MNRAAPPGGEAATWKGLVIIGGAVLLGLLVTKSFAPTTTVNAGSQGNDVPSGKTTATVASTVPASTTTTAPLRDPKDVKVVVANATATKGATKKVVDALKPACYDVQLPVEATAKVKDEKRPTTTVYSTPGYEREAAQITTRLGLQTTSNAALPPEPPIPKTGVPEYKVLVLVGQDLVDTPPQPLPPCEGGAATGSSTSTASTRRGATTTAGGRSPSTTARATTTTRARTTTTKLTTTVT